MIDNCWESKKNNLLTIVTPTYNRQFQIGKLYDSLIAQTNKQFQWLIIDDGSDDETEQCVKSWIEAGKIEIDYHKKNNGGKHTAINFSHEYIRGEYVVIVDSDDILTREAVEAILSSWDRYSDDDTILGITFQKASFGGKISDTNIRGEYISTFSEELNRGMKGEHCETYRREVFLSSSFPVFESEKFVSEIALWYLLVKYGKVVYVDEVIYLFEYLSDGLTKNVRRLLVCNPQGAYWNSGVMMDKDFKLVIRIKYAILRVCYGIFCGKSIRELLRETDGKLIVLMALVPGCLIFLKWKHYVK